MASEYPLDQDEGFDLLRSAWLRSLRLAPLRDLRRRARVAVGQLLGAQGDLQVWWTPQLPFTYVANPKAGTSSIQRSLKQAQAGAHDRARRHYTRSTDPHVSDDCLRRDGRLPRDGNPRFLISCVRNPFTRTLSAYLDKVSACDAQPYLEFRGRTVRSFEDYLRALQDCSPQLLNPHFRPQHVNLDCPRLVYDAIFYLENPAAIDRFLSQIVAGFRLERYAPHARAAAEQLKVHYNERALRLVREIYAEDFELFGYSLALEDAAEAPGDLIAGGRLVPRGAELEPCAPRGSKPSAALRNALRIRRLADLHLL